MGAPDQVTAGESAPLRGEVVGAEFYGQDIPDDCVLLRIVVPDSYRVAHVMVDITEVPRG